MRGDFLLPRVSIILEGMSRRMIFFCHVLLGIGYNLLVGAWVLAATIGGTTLIDGQYTWLQPATSQGEGVNLSVNPMLAYGIGGLAVLAGGIVMVLVPYLIARSCEHVVRKLSLLVWHDCRLAHKLRIRLGLAVAAPAVACVAAVFARSVSERWLVVLAACVVAVVAVLIFLLHYSFARTYARK